MDNYKTHATKWFGKSLDGDSVTRVVAFLRGFVVTVPKLVDVGKKSERVRFKMLVYNQKDGKRESEFYDVTLWRERTAGYDDVGSLVKGDYIQVLGDQHQYSYPSGAHGLEISAVYVEQIRKEGAK